MPERENPLVEGLEHLPVHPATLVIFGATGDLAMRKLLPALYNLAHEGSLPERFKANNTAMEVLAERFDRYLGEPPLTYLARWRLQLAARLLRSTRKTVMNVAMDVGYESEAAFNRAFKREFGAPPAQYRRRMSEAAITPAPAKTALETGAIRPTV